ncbi:heavy metal translocating P-type ATPase metal-binding domain-containing protein [Marixanthomonas sp. SCSIO 43207]|uniref:heavy metal translocating P-type ATPase n=1 Tax=Marixanthomonas sp. SCSIO 43207 TaxID=2779360 RepID=UPI001CA8790D|nr:heavy metal translocating P-type ATPase metal-binding domain-containing protein [Marixanthomonas sp. SCSIO 43207]UAB80986.1 heavy metal translocating P-type ATPase metal-binding domain-containing protein [Marixanthomonas sp. SCSIO 43207]
MTTCFHCGDPCIDTHIVHHEKSFCCHGCKTVYEILNENNLDYYYTLEQAPGSSPKEIEGRFDFLDNQDIVEKLVEFNDATTQIVSFVIPTIHCSSCIWVLENLNKLDEAIQNSQVNFPEKTIRITYSSEKTTLKKIVVLLSKLGYEPTISLENSDKKEKSVDRSLIYKLGVAGFAFGNVMFLSFPEYFEVNEFWLEQFKHVFRWLMFAFSVPVVFYSGRDYFTSAYKGIRSGILNIDIPIAIGISVLFLRSTIEIIFDWDSGFFDSLTGLVFFLLLGKFFQQKTYSYLSFERDYKSYFPIAVTRLKKAENNAVIEEQAEVYKIKKGDRLLIRNNELLPVDAILIKGNALIDYSFVTGEAEPVSKNSGDKLYAGGRQQAGIIEVEALKEVQQSYLTQLWSNDVFSKDKNGIFQSLTDSISKRFTLAILSIAFVSTLIWLVIDPSKAFNVFTAVLIVACPCAIALAAPFTLGNLLRIFGRNKLYLKEASVIEQLAKIDTVVFDKTGTLTTNRKNIISYEGIELTEDEKQLLTSTLRASNHPLSRALYSVLKDNNIKTLDFFEEETGKGIKAEVNQSSIKVGSFAYVNKNSQSDEINQLHDISKTAVHVSANNVYKGCYIFQNEYRKGVSEIFTALSDTNKVIILSGDNDGERETLKKLVPESTSLIFNQKPDDKLQFIHQQQQQGKKVMMIGDGLNDAGALKQSDVGIVISENINVFSPACDGILDASMFKNLVSFIDLSKKGIAIIKWAFILSLVYNVIGLSFAVTGHLKPVIAAILMPLSSISIVVFTTLATQYASRKLRMNLNNQR